MGNGTEEPEIRNSPGVLIFEYFEQALPYHRAPLADTVSPSTVCLENYVYFPFIVSQ